MILSVDIFGMINHMSKRLKVGCVRNEFVIKMLHCGMLVYWNNEFIYFGISYCTTPFSRSALKI